MHLDVALTLVLCVMVTLLVAAQFLRIPYPILLAVGGAALGLMPGAPEVELEPDLVLLILLPPILYGAAFFTPLRELRRNVRAISFLAVGLVLATMVGVAENGDIALGQANNTSFLRPPRDGSVHAEGTPIHRGRSSWVWDVRFTDDEDRLCAISRVTIAVRPAPKR